MDKHPSKESGLLKQYVSDGSEAAFARLAERHIKLVYSVCLRELRRPDLADDATQLVFITLAQKARTIRTEAELARWLYTAARFKASTLRKQEQVRMAKELQAGDMAIRQNSQLENEAWNEIEPTLHDAIHSLGPRDQEAILLRYFEDLSLREVGQAMGTNEVAARMRVSRALEKLRTALVKRKAADVPAGVLAALLSARATCAVPAQLSASVAQSAGARASSPPLMGAGGPGAALNYLLAKGLILMSTTKIAVAGVSAAVILIALCFVVVHKLHSPSAHLPLTTWQAPQATDSATLVAQQQIQAQLGRWAQGMESPNNYSEFLGTLSKDVTFNGRFGMKNYQQFAREGQAIAAAQPLGLLQPLPDRSMDVKIDSCSIAGNTATVVANYRTHEVERYSINARTIGNRAIWTETIGDADDVYRLTLTNTSGTWLISRWQFVNGIDHPYRTIRKVIPASSAQKIMSIAGWN